MLLTNNMGLITKKVPFIWMILNIAMNIMLHGDIALTEIEDIFLIIVTTLMNSVVQRNEDKKVIIIIPKVRVGI